MQNDFTDPRGALYVNGAEHIVEDMNKHLKGDFIAKAKIDSIMVTKDTHEYTDLEIAEFPKTNEPDYIVTFPPHCIIGSVGWELSVDLPDIKTNEYCKNVFDISSNGTFIKDNRALVAKGLVDEYLVCGVATDICVKYAVHTLIKIVNKFNMRVKVSIIKPWTAGIDPVESIKLFELVKKYGNVYENVEDLYKEV
jgi:nicotinamidase-related amidase